MAANMKVRTEREHEYFPQHVDSISSPLPPREMVTCQRGAHRSVDTHRSSYYIKTAEPAETSLESSPPEVEQLVKECVPPQDAWQVPRLQEVWARGFIRGLSSPKRGTFKNLFMLGGKTGKRGAKHRHTQILAVYFGQIYNQDRLIPSMGRN